MPVLVSERIMSLASWTAPVLQVRCMAAVLLMVGQRLEHPDIVQQLLDINQTPCKPQYRYASEVSDSTLAWCWPRARAHDQHVHPISHNLVLLLQEPLLFSRCVYKNIRMRVSDRSRAQTLQIVEQAADKYRIGSSIYMHLAAKLRGESYNVHQTSNNERHSHGVNAAPHVKMLKREKEPDIAERLRVWSQIQSECALAV